MAYNEDPQVSASSITGAVNVRVATTTVLPGTPTYANGTLGVGATLTRVGNGTLGTIDGITPFVNGDRILVKNQVATLENGVYTVTDIGGGGTPYILTRATDADTQADNDNLIAIASTGTANKGIPYGQQTELPVMGTDPLVFLPTAIYLTQRPTGVDNKYNIPVYSGNSRQLTKGTTKFIFNYDNNIFTVGSTSATLSVNNNTALITAPTTGIFNAGDLTNNTGCKFYVNTTTGNVQVQATTTFYVYKSELIPKRLIFTDTSSNTYGIGDLDAFNNGTYIVINDATQLVSITNVPTYANDAAAIVGGLVTGNLYKTTSVGVTSLNIVP